MLRCRFVLFFLHGFSGSWLTARDASPRPWRCSILGMPRTEDLEEDRKERPHNHAPSRAITRHHAPSRALLSARTPGTRWPVGLPKALDTHESLKLLKDLWRCSLRRLCWCKWRRLASEPACAGGQRRVADQRMFPRAEALERMVLVHTQDRASCVERGLLASWAAGLDETVI